MSTAPILEPVMEPQQDPIDLLIAIEEASQAPIRPEYIEGAVSVPPQPNDQHNDGAFELSYQFRVAGIRLVGMNNGYRAAHKDGRTMALVIPDFYVRRRRPSDLDESYRRAHKGWYPIDMVALVGEVTSSNHETDTGPKLRTYAAADVPVYVLIDRHAKTATCHSVPVDGHYTTRTEVDLGRPLPLPEPYPTLDTAPFTD
ncbi:Uma2 family endonuclease [Streptomyces kunmingensis]|uniref:Uma2 family endonuclease n=1 Tax=Streptomyces kunmingensis TaxID=68225 RepID=A0ABU6CD72_9ACTN|nr:Uma2 family endonuclease [Streptomyces kunmingensis]MEB3962404.1 Uma2 family endonuclease [Streptomyces kunmingensis]